jgi:ABC-type transporter Mla subunit MlaD
LTSATTDISDSQLNLAAGRTILLKKLLSFIVIIIFIVGWIFVFRNFTAQNNVVITFTDSKLLTVRTKAYFAGKIAGMVLAIEPTPGRKEVKITVNLKENVYKQINSETGFFIDKDPYDPEQYCLLIALSHKPGKPITSKSRLRGIDSSYSWTTFTTVNRIANAIDPKPEPKSADDLNQAWNDIRKAFSEIDTEKMADKLREKTNQLQQDFDHLMQSKKVQRTLTKIDRKLDELQQAVTDASNSQEVQKLKKSLADLFLKLKRETPKPTDVEA